MPLIDKIESSGVSVRILNRYGIENYFSRTALERVLGRDLSGQFPLDQTRSILKQINGYDKSMAVDVLKHLAASDFDGTDVAIVIEEIQKHIEKNML